MPSLTVPKFRQRTQSTPHPPPSSLPFRALTSPMGYQQQNSHSPLTYESGGGGADEFGRFSPVGKKKKKKDTDGDDDDYDDPSGISSVPLEEGSFIPLINLPPSSTFQRPSSPLTQNPPPPKDEQLYGHLAYQRNIVLPPSLLEPLVKIVTTELSSRGLQVPLLFSSLAIDLNQGRVKRLIDSFLGNYLGVSAVNTSAMGLGAMGKDKKDPSKFLEDARFASPLELGMLLRWGLARVLSRFRIPPQQPNTPNTNAGSFVLTRGLLDLEMYLKWREDEEANSYPPSHILTYLPTLPSTISQILTHLLTLFTLLLPHSHTSGLTPTVLSREFGALLFGLPPTSFHTSYASYLASLHATEHLILAWVRNEELHANKMGGLPPRLKEWVKGYPSMLPTGPPQSLYTTPPPGSKLRRVLVVRRNVRFYSSDLVRSGACWASSLLSLDTPGGGTGRNEFASSKEWARICPPPSTSTGGYTYRREEKLVPKYSDTFWKRMNLPPGALPQTQPWQSSSSTTSTNSPSLTSAKVGGVGSGGGSLASSLGVGLGLGNSLSSSSLTLNDESEQTRFKSLTDMKWGEFENLGFGAGLERQGKGWEFDLNESARRNGPTKRSTLTWSDFSQQGFGRPLPDSNAGSDSLEIDVLEGALEFDKHVLETVKEGDKNVEELGRKLRKNAKNLPPFGWDTSPVTSEEMMEEGYLNVFCDVIYGGGVGWMDRTDKLGLGGGGGGEREGSWGLVEFKSFPNTGSPTSPHGTSAPNFTASVTAASTQSTDPRTGTTLILFEEFVPMEYRAQLIKPEKRSVVKLFPLPGTIGGKSKKWKQAQTLNGSPYVIGRVPTSTMTFGAKGRGEREREFEGLLEGGKSGTTLRLTMDGKKEVKTASFLSSSTSRPQLTTKFTSASNVVGGGTGTTKTGKKGPLYAADAGEEYPRKFDRAPTFPLSLMTGSGGDPASPSRDSADPASGNPMAGGDAAFSPGAGDKSTPRRSRFRLPVPGSARRQRSGGLRMSDLDAVEFETRTMGSFAYSDDDSESGGDQGGATLSRGHSRQRSKDDAWVDILINGRDRRMDGQDFSRPSRDGHHIGGGRKRSISDPELARAEIARTILEAGTPPPDLPSPKRETSVGGGVSRSNNRQGGIFEFGTGGDAEPGYGYGEDIQEVDYVPQRVGASGPNDLTSAPEDDDDEEEDEYEPNDVPELSIIHPSVESVERDSRLARRDSNTLPTAPVGGGGFKTPEKPRESAVSALIEMYRGKETAADHNGTTNGIARLSGTSGNQRPLGSRLPIRTTSIPSPPKQALPPVPDQLDEDLPPIPIKSAPIDVPASPPLGILDAALENSSPARYVHGAPLHNLPEEEEE